MKTLLIKLLKCYKRRISPHLPGACRYTPTCSEYGIVAITRFGALKGSVLTALRVLRCNPFFKGGLDPVPDRKKDLIWLI